MTHTFTTPQKRLLQKLLKAGRWQDEGEIVRHGLKLVANELKKKTPPELAPYSPTLLARAYRRNNRREQKEERAMAEASAGPQPGELE